SRNVYHTAIRRALRPVRPAGASLQMSTAAPEAWHRSGTLARAGTPRWRTREEKRPNCLTMPREALPAHLSSVRLLAMAPPHWMLVGRYGHDTTIAESFAELQAVYPFVAGTP